MYVKICGATSPADIDLLAGLGVDYVGVWHGTGGRSEVDLATLARLGRHASRRVHPVLVTLAADPGVVARAAAEAGAAWVQLHGYQQPSVVRKLKAAGLSIIKALHINETGCVERSLIGAYERAGTDLFLLDALSGGQVGSTGHRLDPAVVAGLAQSLNRPFLLAGGVSADRAGIPAHPGMHGVDVDSAARGPDGRFCPRRVAAVVAAWRSEDSHAIRR